MAGLQVLISIVLLTCYCGKGEEQSSTIQPPPINRTTIQPPDNLSLRHKLLFASNYLSNTLHKRFHKNQQVIMYMETEVDENFIFNPLEILCTGTMLMSGMVNGSDFAELREFLALRKAHIYNQDLFKAMQQYLKNDAYNVSLGPGRKIHLSTDIFINRDFHMLPSFKSNAETRFRSHIHDLSKYGKKTKQKEIQEFVKHKTNNFIGPLERMNRDFHVMMTTSTYIQDYWLYPLEETKETLVLTCTIGKKEFKLPTSTRVISTWYMDESDRFGILIPFKRAKMSVFFYVPKTDDLFKELDDEMNYNEMTRMVRELLETDIVSINATFPLISLSYSRNLTYDMNVQGVKSIFTVDAIRYKNMTEDTNLVVSDVFHESYMRMTEDGCNFASITDLSMIKVNSSLANENAVVLKDLVQENTDIEISDDSESEENVDLLHKKLNNPLYKNKKVGRKKKSSMTPYVTTTADLPTQISDISKGHLSTACKMKKRKLKPKRRRTKKCRKAKKLRTARSRKSYKAIPAPPYFEPTSTLSPNSNTMYHNFLGESQETEYYTPFTSAGTEVYETESSRKPEMNRKSINAEETLLGYESKSNHRQNKALWPEDPTTKWGLSKSNHRQNKTLLPEDPTTKWGLSKSNHRQNKALWPEDPTTKWGLSKSNHGQNKTLLPEDPTTKWGMSKSNHRQNKALWPEDPTTKWGLSKSNHPQNKALWPEDPTTKWGLSKSNHPQNKTLWTEDPTTKWGLSKSNHRQNKALWPEDPTTKWGFFRPRFTWTGPGTTRQGHTFPQESISSVAIKSSFFFAIVSHDTGRVFAYGKVGHCKP